MKIKDAKLGHEYRSGYGEGAVPGYGCTVEVQTGDMSYQTATIALPTAAVDRIMRLIATETQAMFAIDLDAIDVVGRAGVPRPPVDTDSVAETREMVDPL